MKFLTHLLSNLIGISSKNLILPFKKMKELNVQKQTKNYKEMGSDNVKRKREGENEGKGGR